VEFPGAIYHVMDRGDRREDILIIGTAKGAISSCSIARAVDNTNPNPRGPANHAHNWNSNLRFETPFGVTGGARKEVIIAEIGKSKSVLTQADITALQQSNPNIDADIIKCMKNHPS
jgi:hypothetical protein